MKLKTKEEFETWRMGHESPQNYPDKHVRFDYVESTSRKIEHNRYAEQYLIYGQEEELKKCTSLWGRLIPYPGHTEEMPMLPIKNISIVSEDNGWNWSSSGNVVYGDFDFDKRRTE